MSVFRVEGFGAWVPGPRCVRPATGRGVLDGARLAVKDLVDVAGSVTGGGNPDRAASGEPAAHDAPAVARLRAAGAAVIGKTMTDELAFSLEGENAHYGTPRNPRAPSRLPGGSSSGSAVAVAANLADIAIGTDTGGSVRVPASFCGVYAMRPTHGRVPLEGVLPFAPSYDTVGWFARDAALLAEAGHVLLGTAPSVDRKPLRLRIAMDAVTLANADCAAALQAVAVRLGISDSVHVFAEPWQEWLEAYSLLQCLEIQETLGPWIRDKRPRFGLNIAPRFEGALELAPARGEAWRQWRARVATRLHAELGPDDAWLVPAAPSVALPLAAIGDERGAFYRNALALGALAGHAGLPQVVMPLVEVNGLPLGVAFIAGPGNDERLLAMARGCERQKEKWK